ncbi:hypothetical protein IAR50_006020 [Cryptococcus sp. DSM 104548]
MPIAAQMFSSPDYSSDPRSETPSNHSDSMGSSAYSEDRKVLQERTPGILFDGCSSDPTDALMDFESVIAHPLSAHTDIQTYCTLVYRCTHPESMGQFYSSPRTETEIREGARAALAEKQLGRGFFFVQFPCSLRKPRTTTL